MTGMTQRCRYCLGSAVVLAAVCMIFAFTLNLPGQGGQAGRGAQGREGNAAPRTSQAPAGFFDPGLNTHLLPPGGPAPRLADGHVDLAGRYYPNGAGRMIGSYTPVIDSDARGSFVPGTPPQEDPAFRPETKEKYQFPTPYGICVLGGTPTSITDQIGDHGPVELIQLPGRLWILTEYPQTIRYVPTDGRPHSKDPDVSFSGESVGHWEGDTLVVDTIAIDERARNVYGMGAKAWSHSDKEHVVERFSRPSKNFLTYLVTIVDPVVLEKPFTVGPMRWSLAQDPNDIWTEYLCTANETSDKWRRINEIDPDYVEAYEGGKLPTPGNRQ
jgi:hypothetical protein